MANKTTELVKESLALVEQVRPLFAGKEPHVVGAALAELTGMLMLGHPPVVRKMLLATHYRAVAKMVEMYASANDPWDAEDIDPETKQ